MPTYEYRCKECAHDFEIVQAFTDDALSECPKCGGPLRKVFGNVGISFKGSGFYKTDHGSRAKPASGATGDKGDNGSTTPSESPAKADTASTSDSSAKSESTAA